MSRNSTGPDSTAPLTMTKLKRPGPYRSSGVTVLRLRAFLAVLRSGSWPQKFCAQQLSNLRLMPNLLHQTMDSRDAAIMAARIGLVRGDLWSEAAFAYGDVVWNQDKNASNADVASFEQTRAVIEQAIAYAPHDSRLWLLLAANYFRFDWLNERAAASLKMSYYTGSNTIAVVPERLLLAIQSHALEDDEFQELVRHDIRIAVNHKSELMSALVAAYNNAPLSGRQFIEKALGEY